MKFIVFLCLLITNYGVFAKKTNDNYLGVSNKKILDVFEDVLKGFKNIMHECDENVDIPALDPLSVNDISWNYKDGDSKHNILVGNTDTGTIQGLSNFNYANLKANARDLVFNGTFSFKEITAFGKYVLDGFLYKKLLPLNGEGKIKIKANNLSTNISLTITPEQNIIVVDEVKTTLRIGDIQTEVEGLMNLPNGPASVMLSDILKHLYETKFKIVDEKYNKFITTILEEKFSGMTMSEFFDFIDYVSSKAKSP